MDDKAKQLIEIYKKCDGFFKEALDEAIRNQHVQISEEAAFYLMGVLVGHLEIEESPDGRAMAQRYHEALLASGNKKSVEFKKLGDASLLVAGIWWQSLLRKLVDVDYYIDIGRRAYQLAGKNTSKSFSEIFEELSDNFVDIVDIIAEATRSISEAKMSDTDILRMYEVWLRTHNPFLETKLRELGINVVPGKTTRQ